jgi:hypothetical protein
MFAMLAAASGGSALSRSAILSSRVRRRKSGGSGVAH